MKDKKRQNIEQKPERKNSLIRYMMYLLLVALVLSGVTLSRYATTLSGVDTARVAVFAYEIAISKNSIDSNNANNDDRYFTSTNGDASTQAEFEVSIYATSMLADAVNCMFDDVARVIDVKITNNSEVTADMLISGLTEMTTDGIVWCLFSEVDGYTGYQDILDKLGYVDSTFVPAYADLIDDLKVANAETIDTWNDETRLNPKGDNKTLTIVFWAEHEAVLDNGGWELDSNTPLEQEMKFRSNVVQVD